MNRAHPSRTLSLIAALALAAPLALAQQPLAQPPTKPIRQALAFEVASIHPHQGPLPSMDFSSSGLRVRIEGYNLRGLIMEAYNFRNFQVSMPSKDEQENTFYDIVAIAPEGTAPTRDEFRRMLQSLLAERFSLKAHFATKEMPVYALVVGKSGPKFKESTEDGRGLVGVNGRNQYLSTPKTTMDGLADTINNIFMVDRPVVDRTSLTGTYKLRLEATPDFRMRNPQPEDISVFTAVQQLGLRLDPQKAAVQILIVDHFQPPTPN